MEPSTAVDVSVLMPVFNAAEFVAEALDSIFCQTFLQRGTCEIVVVDDGSTDNSVSIIEEYKSKSQIPMHIITQETNAGIVNALNVGLLACRGRYIARMDADDVCMPDRLERQYDFMQANHNVDVLGGSVLMFKHGTKLVKKVDAPADVGSTMVDMFFHCCIAHPTIMVRREFYSKYQYDQDFIIAEDYRLWLRAISEGKVIMSNLPAPHVLRLRKHERNESKTRSDIQVQRSQQALSSTLTKLIASTSLSKPAIGADILAQHMFYDKMPSDPAVLSSLVATLLIVEDYLLASSAESLSKSDKLSLQNHITSRLGAYAAHELKLLALPASECPTWRIWLSRSPSSQWFNLVSSIQQEPQRPAEQAPVARQSPTATERVTVICFSKDRAFQLKEYLRSLLLFVSNVKLDIFILWKAATETFRESYLMLAKQFPSVNFVEETNFAKQLLELVDPKTAAEFILWGVDDVLWYNHVDMLQAINVMSRNQSILATHFRLSPNITYCHPSNAHSVLPSFDRVNESEQFLLYDRTKATEDWNYPFELCATLMHRSDVISTLDSIRVFFGEDALSHPNKLEVSGARLFAKNMHDKSRLTTCMCMRSPVLSVVTINRVQDVCENRIYEQDEYDLETLDAFFREGREFDLNFYRQHTFNAVHIGDCQLVKL